MVQGLFTLEAESVLLSDEKESYAEKTKSEKASFITGLAGGVIDPP